MIVVCPSCDRKNRVPPAATGVPHCGTCGSVLPWTAEADDESFDEVVVESNVPVMLDIWAPWCGPCRMVSPALDHLANKNAGEIKLVKVNADIAPGVSQRFGVQGIPTILLLDHGTEVSRQIGAAPEAQLATWLETSLATLRSKRGG